MGTRAYQGRGSKLAYSLDGVNYSNIAYLQRVAPGGSSLAMLDGTTIGAAAATPIPSNAVNYGEISISGVLDPTDPSQIGMRQMQDQKTLAFFELIFPEGTMLAFTAYISRFTPASIDYAKAITFSATLTISGKPVWVYGRPGPPAPGPGNPAFQPNAFDSGAFQTM